MAAEVLARNPRFADELRAWLAVHPVALYGLFGVAWIWGTGYLVALVALDADHMAHLEILKGWLFVGLTCLLLYRGHRALSREIVCRREVEQALQTTICDLEAFSYTVSHDLRAPLATVNAFATSLLESESAVLTERGQHRLSRIVAGARRMDTMISDILACSRAERSEMRWRVVDVRALANEVVAEAKESWPAATVTVGEIPAAYADGTMLRQVLANLVGNALKFSAAQPDARVEIFGVRNGDAVEVTVRDNGAGFDMAYSAKLFGMFQRLHTEAEFPGTGIGLAIVKRLLSRMRGSIGAHSVPGGWTTFCFSLEGARQRRTLTRLVRPCAPRTTVHG